MPNFLDYQFMYRSSGVADPFTPSDGEWNVSAGDITVEATQKIVFDGSSGTTYITESSDNTLGIYTSGSEKVRIDSLCRFAQDVIPTADAGRNMGSASRRWKNAYVAEFIELTEMTAPGTPAAGNARLYTLLNGAITELHCIFDDGTSVKIAESLA